MVIGGSVITQQNQVLYDKLSDAAGQTSKGINLKASADAFNQFAANANTTYRATVVRGENSSALIDLAMASQYPFIGRANNGYNHAQVYERLSDDEVKVYSSSWSKLEGTGSGWTWSQSKYQTVSDTKTATGPHEVVIIDYNPHD